MYSEIAGLLEKFARSAPAGAAVTAGERRASTALRECRLCYDPIAGRLGTGVTDALVRNEWLVECEPYAKTKGLVVYVAVRDGNPAQDDRLGRASKCAEYAIRQRSLKSEL